MGTFDLQIEQVATALEAGEAQLSRWLTAKGHLSDEDLQATSLVMGPLIGPEQRFVRGKFLVNDDTTQAPSRDGSENEIIATEKVHDKVR